MHCADVILKGKAGVKRMVSYKIPYGFSNYKEIRAGKYLYVDKTKYIEGWNG